MAESNLPAATLLIHCDDQPGLVASITQFIHAHKGNILDLDQHTDKDHKKFFMRVAWETDAFTLPQADIGPRFQAEVAEPFAMQWQLSFSEQRPRMAVFVSKMFHCLYDILAQHQAGELQVEIPLIVSNHADVQAVAEQFDVACHVFPIDKANKAEQEAQELALLEQHNIDFIVLARYMQVLSDDFVRHYPNRIINIHHSFLPAFPGAKPYHSAYSRGVKIIGATSHYVTAELDAGPIIEQDVAYVSHKDSVTDLIRKGRDLEKLVLSRAVWHHIQRKVLVYDNRTVIFS